MGTQGEEQDSFHPRIVEKVFRTGKLIRGDAR
jgi:hypothetical protein